MSLNGRHEFPFARLIETTLINLYVATFQERITLFLPLAMQHRNGKPTILKAFIKKGRKFHCCDRQRGLSFKSMKTPSFRQTYQQRIMIFIPETWEKMNQSIRGVSTPRCWGWNEVLTLNTLPAFSGFSVSCHVWHTVSIRVLWLCQWLKLVCSSVFQLFQTAMFRGGLVAEKHLYTSVSNDAKLPKKSWIGEMLQVH